MVAPGTQAALIVEVDGTERGVEEDLDRVVDACRAVGAKDISRAKSEAERDTIWSLRRQTSVALKKTGLIKINHDVVVPRGRVPELFDVIADMKSTYTCGSRRSDTPAMGNIHVNLLLKPATRTRRARQTGGAISLHAGGRARRVNQRRARHRVAKAPYLPIELSATKLR
jgi:FAD/FMN-containing dehydrogenase